jgi:hypothetical protein
MIVKKVIEHIGLKVRNNCFLCELLINFMIRLTSQTIMIVMSAVGWLKIFTTIEFNEQQVALCICYFIWNSSELNRCLFDSEIKWTFLRHITRIITKSIHITTPTITITLNNICSNMDSINKRRYLQVSDIVCLPALHSRSIQDY